MLALGFFNARTKERDMTHRATTTYSVLSTMSFHLTADFVL